MRDGERGPRARRLRSMGWRVGLVAVASAAFGGFAAAVVAIVAVDHLLSNQADLRLRAATVTLAGELDEDLNEKNPEDVVEVVEDENGEIVTSGIRLAVFEAGLLLAGDSWMQAPGPGQCETRRVAGARVRSCAGTFRSWTLVAAQPIDQKWLHWVYGLAAIGAVLLGGTTGAISSVALSRWAVRPLLALAYALRASRADAPGRLELGAASSSEEVEQIRSALLELAGRLQVLLDQAHRFAGDAAHELRTPLTALRAELELLAEESSDGDRPAIDRALARVARLAELLDRLLVLALPADNLSSGFENVSVADVAEEAVGELTAEQRARVRLELHGEGLVRGDPRLLESLLANALQNALKFAPDGAITVQVVDRPRGSEPASVSIEVRDEGPGVPSQLRERVFEPFYRVRPGATGGQGLGLALIGHIARAHGGRAAFRDSDRGARLEILLPAWSAS